MKALATVVILVLLLTAFSAHADTAMEVTKEINLVRTNPGKYVEYLQEWKSRYIGRSVKLSDTLYLRTKENVNSVDEAIEFMKKRKPIEPLVRSKGLDMAARRMVKMQGPTAQMGHYSPDGLSPAERAGLYGKWVNIIGENISYGLDEPRQIVMMWIIDDGVPERVHRENIFKREFKVAGAAFGPHRGLRVVCVVDFAGGFKMKK